MKNLLEQWLEFAKDVQASCAAGELQLDSLRRRTEAALRRDFAADSVIFFSIIKKI